MEERASEIVAARGRIRVALRQMFSGRAAEEDPIDIDYEVVRRLLVLDAQLVVDLYELDPDRRCVGVIERDRAQAYLRS